MRSLPFAPAALALAASLATGQAQALDYSGYFRAGPGLTSEDASRACYALNGGSAGMKYRLGNECDFYGEFQLAQGFKTEGIDTRVTLMVNLALWLPWAILAPLILGAARRWPLTRDGWTRRLPLHLALNLVSQRTSNRRRAPSVPSVAVIPYRARSSSRRRALNESARRSIRPTPARLA